MYDCIIIGGGPAGLTAAVYLKRAGKSVLILEKDGFGGQISHSPCVENFPGYAKISGMELGDKMFNCAAEQGAEFDIDEVISVEDNGETKSVKTSFGAEHICKTVIIATGAKHKTLGLHWEEEFSGNGVYYCAVCDGAFFKGGTVAVAGGGNSALQEAMFLSNICNKVYLIHRRNEFRGEQNLMDTLKNKENVEFVTPSVIKSLNGTESLDSITVDINGTEREISADALFVAIGHTPDNSNFKNIISIDEKGYADSDESCETVTPGVFVAGDCRNKKVFQAATAVSDGAVAATAAAEYINRND